MALKPGFAIEEGLEPQVKKFFYPIKIGRHGEQISATQPCHTGGMADVGGAPSRCVNFCNFLEKNGYFIANRITFRTFSEPFERTKFLMFESQLKSLPLLQVKSKTRLKSCILGLNFVIWPKSGKSRYIAFCNIFSIK